MTKRFIAAAFFIALFLLKVLSLHAQVQDGTFLRYDSAYALKAGQSYSIPLPFIYADQKKKLKSGNLLVSVNTGAIHKYSNIAFNYSVTFTLQPMGETYTLTVNGRTPQSTLRKDLTGQAGPNGGLYLASIQIQNVTVSGATTTAGINLADSLRLRVHYDLEYGFDITSYSTGALLSPAGPNTPIVTGKTATLSWGNNGYYFPDYEVQVQRLYNLISGYNPGDGNTYGNNDRNVFCMVDWSKALKLETQSGKTSLSLTLSEGQGYYLWRVRPIGSYDDGGIASGKNYSDSTWTTFVPDSAYKGITPATALPGLFFFADPDSTRNYTYSRTITEQNKVSERISYTDGLASPRQSQEYVSSKDTLLTTHTLQDFSGRNALSTLPIGSSGKLPGYKPQFLQAGNTANTLYAAPHFDDDTSYRNPDKVTGGEGAAYYSDKNPDRQIPDAEGYPFSRILYYDDGRVKEQAAGGKTHMLGDGLLNHGKGKTVKTHYGTPSEMELVRLFGDEAPAAESVQKTITTDQNGTATITYVSHEGEVIATSLASQSPDNTPNTFDPVSDETPPGTVFDTIKNSLLAKQGYVSSKRIVLLQPTSLNLSYAIRCRTIEDGCNNITVKCAFKVKLSLHRIDGGLDTTLAIRSVDSLPCIKGYVTASWPALSLPAGTYIVEKSLYSGKAPEVVVSEARDRMEKQIMPFINMVKGWLAGVKCASQLNNFYAKVITLDSNFNQVVPRSNARLDNIYRAQLGIGAQDTFFTSAHTVHITYKTGTNIPRYAFFSSPCCQNIKADLEYNPPFPCDQAPVADKNKNGTIETNYNYFNYPDSSDVLPDLEGYAIRVLLNCDNIKSPQDAQDTLQKYMLGWRPGEFNLMAYHMLSDQYNCEGQKAASDGSLAATATNNPKPYVPAVGTVTECGDTIKTPPAPCNGNSCTQYTCDQVTKCWIAQVMQMKDKVCVDSEESVNDGPVHPSTEFDSAHQGKTQPHNDHFDDNTQGQFFLVKWIVKSKVSKKMRDLQTSGGPDALPVQPSYNSHLVKDFLNCTGYKFAKITNPAQPLPLPADINPGTTYMVPTTDTTTPAVTSRGYRPQRGWKASGHVDYVRNGKAATNLLPHVLDPIYAFKYFEYNEDDARFEHSVCYSDPNDCKDALGNKIPCCYQNGAAPGSFCLKSYDYPNMASVKDGNDGRDFKYVVPTFCGQGRFVCPVTKDYWTCGQRYTFFMALRDKQAVPASFNDQSGNTPLCGTSAAIDLINTTLTSMTGACRGECDSKRDQLQQQLLGVLNDKCYVVGGCKQSVNDNVVPWEAINAMLDSLIANCKRQCLVSTYRCINETCRAWDTPETDFSVSIQPRMDYGVGGGPGENCVDCSSLTNPSYCEFNKYRQVMGSSFRLDIATRCGTQETLLCNDSSGNKITCPPNTDNNVTTGSIPDVADPANLYTEKKSNPIQLPVVTGQ